MLLPIYGSVMLGQGLLMRATRMRIDLTLKMPITAGEQALTWAYAIGWVAFVIGAVWLGFALS